VLAFANKFFHGNLLNIVICRRLLYASPVPSFAD